MEQGEGKTILLFDRKGWARVSCLGRLHENKNEKE
jgi:hypothetical protein